MRSLVKIDDHVGEVHCEDEDSGTATDPSRASRCNRMGMTGFMANDVPSSERRTWIRCCCKYDLLNMNDDEYNTCEMVGGLK